MLVQCPNCHTRYRVADSSVTTSDPAFRCSRCKHVFSLAAASKTLPPEEGASSPPEPRQEEGSENQEFTFSFSASEEPKIFEGADDKADMSFAAEEPSDARVEEEEDAEFAEDETASLSPEEQEGSPPVPSTPREETLSTKPYLSLFGLLVLIYLAVALFHVSHPRSVEAVIRRIPWVGSLVFKNNHLKQGIALKSLRPGFYRIVGNREVFVISGMAVNQNPVGVREVRIEGVIYDDEGKEIERHIIAIGNPLSARIIRDLTPQEVSILQKLAPQKGFEISPEQSREFAIVFLRPSGKNIASFACRVSSTGETA